MPQLGDAIEPVLSQAPVIYLIIYDNSIDLS